MTRLLSTRPKPRMEDEMKAVSWLPVYDPDDPRVFGEDDGVWMLVIKSKFQQCLGDDYQVLNVECERGPCITRMSFDVYKKPRRRGHDG